MDWSNVRVLGSKLIVRQKRPEVSDVIIMLDYPGSTVEVVKSADQEYHEGMELIVDKESIVPATDELGVIWPSAVLAVTQGDVVLPAPGFVLCHYEDRFGIRPDDAVLTTTIPDGRRVVIRAGAGWIIRWRGREYQLVSTDDLLAEVHDEDVA